MCVIIVKPAGVELPDRNTLWKCFDANPHGGGFMWTSGGKVSWRKGFMDFDSMVQAILWSIGKDTVAVIHMRYASRGPKIPSLTHPFPISSEERELTALEGKCHEALAHNGTLSFEVDEQKESDSLVLARNLANTRLHKLVEQGPKWKTELNKLIGSSRIVILEGSGFYKLLGKQWFKRNGCLFSNLLWKNS